MYGITSYDIRLNTTYRDIILSIDNLNKSVVSKIKQNDPVVIPLINSQPNTNTNSKNKENDKQTAELKQKQNV